MLHCSSLDAIGHQLMAGDGVTAGAPASTSGRNAYFTRDVYSVSRAAARTPSAAATAHAPAAARSIIRICRLRFWNMSRTRHRRARYLHQNPPHVPTLFRMFLHFRGSVSFPVVTI
jgi:hypothetical protein